MATKKVNEILSAGFLAAFKIVQGVTPSGVSAANFWDTVERYVLSEYGELTASAMLEYLNKTPATMGSTLPAYLSSEYLAKWQKVLAVLEESYDPLYNVDATETQTQSGTDTFTAGKTDARTLNTADGTTYGHSLTKTHADTDTRTLNTSDAETLNLNDGTTHGKTDTHTHYISGDNGGEVQSGRDVDAASGTDSTTHTGTDTTAHTGTDTLARTGTITDAESGTDTTSHTGTDTLVRSGQDTTVHGHKLTIERAGNIGTTSAQSLVLAELDVRSHTYFDVVCDDI